MKTPVHPPALALHEEDAEALMMALARVQHATEDDRTVAAAQLLRLRQVRPVRVALLARVALEAINARRHAEGRRVKTGGTGA